MIFILILGFESTVASFSRHQWGRQIVTMRIMLHNSMSYNVLSALVVTFVFILCTLRLWDKYWNWVHVCPCSETTRKACYCALLLPQLLLWSKHSCQLPVFFNYVFINFYGAINAQRELLCYTPKAVEQR